MSRQRKSRFQGKVVKLSAQRLYRALREEIAARLYPADQQPHVPPLEFRTKQRTLERSASFFWDKLGKKVVLLKHGRIRGLMVAVPSVDELFSIATDDQDSILFNRLVPVVKSVIDDPKGKVVKTKTEKPIKVEFFQRFPELARGRTNELDELKRERQEKPVLDCVEFLRAFEQLRGREQTQVFDAYRTCVAAKIVSVRLEKLSLDNMVVDLNRLRQLESSFPHLRTRSMDSGEPLEYLREEQEHEVRCLAAILPIIDIYYWEEEVAPTTHVGEFLPPGLSGPYQKRTPPNVPKGPIENFVIEDGLELDDEEVTVDTTTIDPERFRFYREELGCKKTVRPKGEFGRRMYEAFLLKSASGVRYAVLDCEKVGNAVYIFRIDRREIPDSARWLEDAQLTKQEVLATAGKGGPFARRIFHSYDWMERVKHFLKQN